MNFILQPWQLLLVILAGWVQRQQQLVIDYLRTERPAMLQCVIVITAASGRDLARLRDEDVFRVLRKPFEIQELLATIEACFTKAQE